MSPENKEHPPPPREGQKGYVPPKPAPPANQPRTPGPGEHGYVPPPPPPVKEGGK
jgi:hypothetical protein